LIKPASAQNNIGIDGQTKPKRSWRKNRFYGRFNFPAYENLKRSQKITLLMDIFSAQLWQMSDPPFLERLAALYRKK